MKWESHVCARAQMYASLSPKAPSTALPLPRDGRDLAHLEVLYAYIPTAAYTPGDTSHANHRHSLFEHERVVPLRDAPPCMRVSNDDSRQACAQAGGGGGGRRGFVQNSYYTKLEKEPTSAISHGKKERLESAKTTLECHGNFHTAAPPTPPRPTPPPLFLVYCSFPHVRRYTTHKRRDAIPPSLPLPSASAFPFYMSIPPPPHLSKSCPVSPFVSHRSCRIALYCTVRAAWWRYYCTQLFFAIVYIRRVTFSFLIYFVQRGCTACHRV